MLTAIPAYGARTVPETQQIISACACKGELVTGPAIEAFEQAFSRRHEGRIAVATSYGRMAFFYILAALDMPVGSEVVFPALTSWVIPEIARALGLKPVFVDVDPNTFNMKPSALDRVLSPKTRAVVPTHLYGLPCDMDEILAFAGKHNLAVIEDCAHSLGALYRGRPVGTFGNAAFFSFDTWSPLSTYGGGMALLRDADVAGEVRWQMLQERWPTESEVRRKLNLGRIKRVMMCPSVFSWTLFPVLRVASILRRAPGNGSQQDPLQLESLPDSYHRRYTNVQAALGLAGLRHFVHWSASTRRNAGILTRAISGLRGIRPPPDPEDRTHVYSRYCIHVPDRDALLSACLRRGLYLQSPQFRSPTSRTDIAANTVQLPVHAALSEDQMRWIAKTLNHCVMNGQPTT